MPAALAPTRVGQGHRIAGGGQPLPAGEPEQLQTIGEAIVRASVHERDQRKRAVRGGLPDRQHGTRFLVVTENWRSVNLANWESRVPVHTGPGGYDRESFDDPGHLSSVVRYDLPRLGRLDGTGPTAVAVAEGSGR
jgi:hypothetical protein